MSLLEEIQDVDEELSSIQMVLLNLIIDDPDSETQRLMLRIARSIQRINQIVKSLTHEVSFPA